MTNLCYFYYSWQQINLGECPLLFRSVPCSKQVGKLGKSWLSMRSWQWRRRWWYHIIIIVVVVVVQVWSTFVLIMNMFIDRLFFWGNMQVTELVSNWSEQTVYCRCTGELRVLFTTGDTQQKRLNFDKFIPPPAEPRSVKLFQSPQQLILIIYSFDCYFRQIW